eukprot:2795455-Pleurochrysis_carterae.AAC.1
MPSHPRLPLKPPMGTHPSPRPTCRESTRTHRRSQCVGGCASFAHNPAREPISARAPPVLGTVTP